MTTEVLVSPNKPKTPADTRKEEDQVSCLSGIVNVVLQTLASSSPSSLSKLRQAVKEHGYTQAEFHSVLKYFRDGPVSLASIPAASSAADASSRNRESSLPVFDPHDAGQRIVEELQTVEGGAWTGPELQTLFNLTPATLYRRRKEHRIIYWRDARHNFHYPKWQFTPSGALLPGIQEVLTMFQSEDEWRIIRYFLGKRAQLGGDRPLDMVHRGEKEKIVAHARIHAEENTW